jgi:class 3 adenylate cyclase
VDIGAWLRGLGLERYEQAFLDNDITPTVLPELTDQDLKDLGVSLGHRRLLLKALRALSEDQAGQSPAPTSEQPSSRPEPTPRSEAERRQLTVMFVDLVGSTELSERLDPEDMGAIIRAYHNCCTEVIQRWDGHIAKFLGDGVLTYFGYPRAHEDDSERAIRAGLALVEAIGKLAVSMGSPITARIGIATGLVVDLVGEGAAQEETVVGETPNLAARLQALAEPNTVVIGPVTRRLAGGFFAYADLGSHRLRGFSTPIQAWRVMGTIKAETRFEAAHTAFLTPFVGREQEIALLMDRWGEAKEGEGQVVLISADPGMGKSRITQVLRERLREESHTRLRYQCSPHHRNSTLYPIIDQLEGAARFETGETAESKLDKLETLLVQSATNFEEVVPLFAALLSIPTGARYPALDLSRQRQKERLLEVLTDQLAGLAVHQPVLFIFEDEHWIDPTSLELLDLIVDRVQKLPVLVVVTFRPEFAPPWTRYPHVTLHSLNRLTRKQVEIIAENTSGRKCLPSEVLDQIVIKTDGVPLFVEELTKTILESELIVEQDGKFILSGPLPAFAIPSTLQDSLMARLDRLAPVKEVAQVGAVIGREFSHELLAAVWPDPELENSLTRLLRSELIFRRGVPPQATYVFKHALVQDAAYATLLRSNKRRLHARVAEVLQSRFSGKVEAEPEVLAHHYTKAGLTDKAITYWLLAGQRATERSANVEAISHLSKGLELLAAQPDTPERAEQELMLQISLAIPLTAARGYAAPETASAYTRARELCTMLGDTRQLFPAMYGEWVFHMVKAHQDEAKRVAEEFLRVAEQHGARDGIVVAHRTLGLSLLNLGQLAAGREQMEQVVTLYEPEAHRSLAFRYGQDPRAVALSFLA